MLCDGSKLWYSLNFIGFYLERNIFGIGLLDDFIIILVCVWGVGLKLLFLELGIVFVF